MRFAINISNKLTIFRIILVFPIILVLFYVNNNLSKYLISGILFLIASYTDYLDGKIARKKNLVTAFGQIMDPLSDKILVLSVLICFLSLNLITGLPVILVIIREFLITSIRFLVLNNNKNIISANIWGKFKTVSQIFLIFFIFISQIYLNFCAKNINLINFYDIFLWITVIFSYISGFVYIYLNKDYIFVDL
ncbi:MAG: CDP-diacylglycerol--glycerol-3-phosphate 3-phosphatidyltransferase [Clostridia bacterium]|nr:CDP-diacylglycerol--glycerol-3-phosphate 3-phosphatidyltransferase [Clostridia bacterium]